MSHVLPSPGCLDIVEYVQLSALRSRREGVSSSVVGISQYILRVYIHVDDFAQADRKLGWLSG